ncbi:MAG: nitroreductase family protein [Desulfobacterales bacterium]|nr:MAG: nitroreductase family protein [Desulfobacterales bacterium]
MSLLTVDQEKCKRDGICAEVCPVRIIEFKDKDAFPILVDGGDKLCIKCGHCVAVCPHGAMSHAMMKPEKCPPVNDDWLFNPEQVEHFLRCRRSVRNYKNNPVDRDVLAKLINVARFAPSGHNLQPVKWLVIYDRDKVQQMAGFVIDWMQNLIEEDSPLVAAMHLDRVVSFWESGHDPICRNAPHVIVTHAHQNDRTAPAACTIALTYLELAAPSFGLGTCWAGYFNAAASFWPAMQKALGLPEGNIIFGSMIVGYPKFKFQRLPLRNDAEIIWQ